MGGKTLKFAAPVTQHLPRRTALNQLRSIILAFRLLSPLRVGNGALQRAGEVDVEERTVEAVYEGNLWPAVGVRLAGA